MKAPLVKSLRLNLSGGSSLDRMASMLVISAELAHLHQIHGYQVKGRRCGGETQRPTWERFCLANGGITEACVRNYNKISEIVKQRLRESGQPDAEALLESMEKQPSTLTADERQRMITNIVRLGLKESDTPNAMRKETLVNPPKPPGKAETCDADQGGPVMSDGDKKAMEIEALALKFGVSPENASRVAAIVAEDQFRKTLCRLATNHLRAQREN